MDTFLDLITAVQSDVHIGAETTLTTPTIVKSLINRIYAVTSTIFRWPQLDDVETTGTIAGNEYYDYPDKWRPNSIWKLTVDGIDYGSPLLFKDFLYEKENSNPSGRIKLWANQGTRYFINPIPTITGSKNVDIFGIKNVDPLVRDEDVTIFSSRIPECNEAIVLEASYRLKLNNSDIASTSITRVGEMRSLEAKQILSSAWVKMREENSKLQKTMPQFDVPDYFRRTNVGRRTTADDF